MAKKFLDLEGLKHFISKIIGKTDISKIGDGTCTGAISALNQSMKLCGTWKDISATTDANGNALIGNVNESQVPIAVTPITIGTRISAINLNGYGPVSYTHLTLPTKRIV